MKDARFLYRCVRPLAGIGLKTNFRKIYFSNAQVLPKDKPVILAVNHPTAFLEPCLLACLLPRPLHFLARGDLFVKKIYTQLLGALHIIPIYRLKDRGYSYVRKNYDSFELCHEALAEQKVIMILAEGTAIQEKRLRPIQKGTARLAFGTLEQYPDLDLQIVPVGVNYTYADRFRSRVMFHFGQPIAAQDYWSAYQENASQAIKDVTTRLREDLEEQIIIIANPADDALAEELLAINRNTLAEASFPIVSPNNHLFKSEKRIAEAVNGMEEEEKKNLETRIKEYHQTLDQHKIGDYAVAKGNPTTSNNLLVIIIGFLPALIGFLGNFPPIYLAYFVATNTVKEIEFMAPVKLAVAIVAFVIYYFVLFLFAISSGYFILILLLFILPFLGYYSLLYREYFDKWNALRPLNQLSPENLTKLKAMRTALLKL